MSALTPGHVAEIPIAKLLPGMCENQLRHRLRSICARALEEWRHLDIEEEHS